MSLKLTYEELSEIIARFVHSHLYAEEQMVDGAVVRLVDNRCSGSLQIATGVLESLSVLVALDAARRRYDFACSPEEFASTVARNKNGGCSYDALILALTCLLSQYPADLELRELVERMGLCEPGDHVQIKWTPKAALYRALYKDWPKLLAE